MSRQRKGLYEFLESSGVLIRNDPEEVRIAKLQYRRQYLKVFKKRQRQQKPEFTIRFLNDADLATVRKTSANHKTKVAKFIRDSCLAYIKQVYIADRAGVQNLELILSDTLNKVHSIISQREAYNFQKIQKIEAIETTIMGLQNEVREYLTRPAPIEMYIKLALDKQPGFREKLLNILTANDSQITHTQDGELRSASQLHSKGP
jgi:hypothetical protein